MAINDKETVMHEGSKPEIQAGSDMGMVSDEIRTTIDESYSTRTPVKKESISEKVSDPKIDALTSELTAMKENFNQLMQQNASLLQTINSTLAPKETEEVDEWEDLYEKNPKAAFEKIVEEREKQSQQKQGLEAQRQKHDMLALQHFPELNNSKSKFYYETEAELRQMEKIDPQARQRVDAIYNAAARVQARRAMGDSVPMSGFVEGSTFGGRTKTRKEPSDLQKRVALRFGTDPSKIYSDS